MNSLIVSFQSAVNAFHETDCERRRQHQSLNIYGLSFQVHRHETVQVGSQRRDGVESAACLKTIADYESKAAYGRVTGGRKRLVDTALRQSSLADDQLKGALKAGAKNVLNKPACREALFKAIESAMQQ